MLRLRIQKDTQRDHLRSLSLSHPPRCCHPSCHHGETHLRLLECAWFGRADPLHAALHAGRCKGGAVCPTLRRQGYGYERWNRDEWMGVKFTKGLPFPNLPYFIDGDVKLTQSSAIQRYICSKWKPELLGRTPAEAGNAAMLEGLLSDLNSAVDKISFSMDGTQEALKETTKTRLEPIASFMGENPFLVGEEVTFVDFILFEWIEKCQDAHIWGGSFFDQIPSLRAYYERMQALPNMPSAEERAAQGLFNGWRAKLGGAGEEMFKKYKQL